MGLRSHVALWASGVLLVLFIFGHYFVGPDRARIVINSLVIGVNLSLTLAWFRFAASAVKNGVKDGVENIYLGVWLWAFISLAYFLWLVGLIVIDPYVAYDLRDWARTTPIGGIFSVGFFLASATLLLTPVNTREDLEPVSLRWWFIAVGIGCFTAGVLMTLGFFGVISLGI